MYIICGISGGFSGGPGSFFLFRRFQQRQPMTPRIMRNKIAPTPAPTATFVLLPAAGTAGGSFVPVGSGELEVCDEEEEDDVDEDVDEDVAEVLEVDELVLEVVVNVGLPVLSTRIPVSESRAILQTRASQ